MKSFIETFVFGSLMVLMSSLTFYGALGIEPQAPTSHHMEASR